MSQFDACIPDSSSGVDLHLSHTMVSRFLCYMQLLQQKAHVRPRPRHTCRLGESASEGPSRTSEKIKHVRMRMKDLGGGHGDTGRC